MITFDRLAPSSALQAYIRCYHYLDHPGGPSEASSQLITPDGMLELNFCLREPVLRFGSNGGAAERLSGIYLTNRASQPYFIKRSGAVRFISVLFEPGALLRFSPFPAGLIADGSIPAIEVFGRSVTLLAGALGAAVDGRAMAEILDRFWSRTARQEPRYAHGLQGAIRDVQASKGAISVGTIAERAGVPVRTLEQLFKEHVGTSPNTYARLLRFKRALRLMVRRPNLPLSAIALEIGYFDQSHLWRDFVQFTGTGPRGYHQRGHVLNDAMIKLTEPLA